MVRDYRLYLDDILSAIQSIEEYTQNLVYDDFAKDKKTQDEVVRNLEIIGEASNQLPESVRASAPEIEWRKIVGIRNILAHEYFGVSLPIIWDVIQNKLDELSSVCLRLLSEAPDFKI